MQDLPINAVDAVIGVVLLLSAIMAFGRGFVHEVMAIAGWVGAIFVTIYGLPLVRPYVRDVIPQELIADLAAGAGLFIVSLVVLSLISRALSAGVKDSALNSLDKSLGFLFGLGRGAVLVSLAWIVFDWAVAENQRPAWVVEAKALPMVVAGADFLRDLVPEDLATRGRQEADATRDRVDRALEAERVLRDVVDPRPTAPDGDPAGTYRTRDRRELERLIQSNQ